MTGIPSIFSPYQNYHILVSTRQSAERGHCTRAEQECCIMTDLRNNRKLPKPKLTKTLKIFHVYSSRRFHVVLVQNNGNEMYYKVCYTCKIIFSLIDQFVVFLTVVVVFTVSLELHYFRLFYALFE